MNTLRTGLTGLVIVGLASCATVNQDTVPVKPNGTLRGEADHREFASRVTTIDWRAPASGMEGFTTFWPDGFYVVTVKLKDGALVHNLGSYHINGDTFCQKARIPANSKENCIRGYRTGENSFEAWNVNGAFAVHWKYRVKQ